MAALGKLIGQSMSVSNVGISKMQYQISLASNINPNRLQIHRNLSFLSCIKFRQCSANEEIIQSFSPSSEKFYRFLNMLYLNLINNNTCRSRLLRRCFSTSSFPLHGNYTYHFQPNTLMSTPYSFFDGRKIDEQKFSELPISIRVLLESALRNCDGQSITVNHVMNILNWSECSKKQEEIQFKPSRIILQDFTGVPAIVDLAAMRDALHSKRLDPSVINPLVPVDLVIDHSIQVDYSRTAESQKQNERMEMLRNCERFKFLKWGANSFQNFNIIPPGSGIIHQVNLEYLCRLIFVNEDKGLIYPDSLLGTDSHTTMVNGLGVVAWGVGGIEAEAVMLGQTVSMVLPEVIGFRLKGSLNSFCNATDLVLTVTEILRKKNVVNKFVEFFGEGTRNLSVADRATVSNMAPEYGATIGFFPVDEKTIEYLLLTGRTPEKIKLIENYYKAAGLYMNEETAEKIRYSDIIEMNLDDVVPSVAGPKRPQDKVDLKNIKKDFDQSLLAPMGFKGYNLPNSAINIKCKVVHEGKEYVLSHGSVVIAAITSCTNTSNPLVMLGAGILARNAVHKNLKVQPFVKTSLSPGSKAVAEYLNLSGLDKYLEKLGFFKAGFGCMTCIGNSGDLYPFVVKSLTDNTNIVVASVLSGNRNFEGRIHPLTRANFLCSPPLVVAFAIAGRINIDFDSEPIGIDSVSNSPVFLKEIWPSSTEIMELENKYIKGEMFTKIYATINKGSSEWQSLVVPDSKLYEWDNESTYIHQPQYFKNMKVDLDRIEDIVDGICLLNLGDSVTTDHISPAGNINPKSPAGTFLLQKGINEAEFNTYGSRRGHDEIMVKGTFANIRLINKMCPTAGPKTINVLDKSIDFVSNVAEHYRNKGIPMIIIAGKEYGTGSSRDWAAKGPALMGVRAIIAESFERIHRSNLVGIGILPLQFVDNQNSSTLNITGMERFKIRLNGGDIKAGEILQVEAVNPTDNSVKMFNAKCRIDTDVEAKYFRHGGILKYVLRKFMKGAHN